MILYKGQLYNTDKQDELLNQLFDNLTATLSSTTLDNETVISAFSRLSAKIAAGELNSIIDTIDYNDDAEPLIDMAVRMMSRDYLEYKIKTELGDTSMFSDLPDRRTQTQRYPLGVIFHIAAGNMDVLPIVSVAEGLLAGNINILKLPSADRGLTVTALKYLVDLEPKLADYIYVFDTPSDDIAAMKRMADLSDGIAVWGGDEAISAVRNLAKPGTRLIEWGHKLGFCYIAGKPSEADLQALAKHIITTRQLLCSSCQVIYLDTEDQTKLKEFASAFLPFLEKAYEAHPISDIGAKAELSLRRYVNSLSAIVESDNPGDNVLSGTHTSVTIGHDDSLELSYMYGNVIVKALPRACIIETLRKHKGYLQTAGLICPPEDRSLLISALLKAGVERVTPPGSMSDYFDGEAHDGEFSLQRYTRFVNIM